MSKVYAYLRISQASQKTERQIENILKEYPNAKIYQEVFTGTTTDRKEWNKLKKILKLDDTVVFDSVSRMSRNAEEGINDYMQLLDKGINLVFLKEPYINTEVYQEQLRANDNIKTDDIDLNDTILKGVRDYLKRLATKQIKIAFEQSEKEVKDLQQRTKEGLRVAKAKGNIGGRKKGVKIETKKAKEMKEKILKLSKAFNGNLKDIEVMELLDIARNSYYKYKRDLLNSYNEIEINKFEKK